MPSLTAGSTANLIGSLFADGSAIGVTDEQLIERFVLQRDEGAEFAFGALVERHGPMVLSVCRNTLRDQDDAEDAFQATFLVLARKASSLRAPGRLRPWLHGVALRTCQKIRAQRSRLDRLRSRVEARALMNVDHESDRETIRQEETEMLHDEIGRLPHRYRTPIVLCCLEGQTQEEAARQLGWPIGTVGVRLMRARERLRSRLTRRGLAPATATLPPIARGEPITGSLAAQTTRLAVNFCSTVATTSSTVPSHIASAAIGVLQSLAVQKAVGSLIAVLLLCGLLACSAVLAFQPPAGRSRSAQPHAPAKAAREADEPRSILTNGGIEKGDLKGSVPDAWQKGARLFGVEYQWDQTVAHQGKASLHLKKTAERYFPIAQWFQEVKRTGTAPRLKVSAFVKAQKMTKAILDVQFIDAAEGLTHKWAGYIGSKNDGDLPATHDWKPYAGIVEIPEGTRKIVVAVQVYGPGDVWVDDIVADYTEEKATDPLASNSPVEPPLRADSDVADISIAERTAGNDPQKRYLLIGPSTAPEAPETGRKLLLVLPGGDGGTEFQTFARRIAKNALPSGYLVAQLVAVSWTPEQAEQIVWPTATNRPARGRVHNRRIRGGGDCRYFADHEDRSALHLSSGLVIGWTTGLCIITESGDARDRLVDRHVGLQAGPAPAA